MKLSITTRIVQPSRFRMSFQLVVISTALLFAAGLTYAQPNTVAHWTADGTTEDVIGGNNGTFQGSGPAYSIGYSGQAFSFDGTNYIVVSDSPAVSPTGPFTIEAWIKPNFNNFQQGIVEKYVTPGTSGFFLRIVSSHLQFGVCGASSPCAVASGFTPVSIGDWHHVIAVCDTTNVRIYLDEVMDAYSAHGGLMPNDGPTTLKIGARGDDANTRFNGLIDDIKIYNIALPYPIPSNQHNVADGDVNGLIAAINLSNATPGPDTINLAQNGNYVLTYVAGPDSYHGPTGLPIVQGSNAVSRASLTINGNGSTIQRSDAPGTPEFRVFYALYANVTLDGVIIRNGRSYGSVCGGGGLYLNVSNTTLRNSTITENWGLEGGGICNINSSTLTIENSTISYNTGYGGRTGGGLLNFSGGQVLISNSTFYENRADGSPGFEGRGDAFADAFSVPNWLVIKNSIVANPTRGMGNDCMWFTPVSLGHNIFSDITCGLNIGSGDMILSNFALGPLMNNGGLTPTHALLPGSAAIDAIPLADCTNTAGIPVASDQRGTSRPIGMGCDIGAVEQDPFDTTPPSVVPTVLGTVGDNGWYTSDVSISWTVTDGESYVSSSSGCDNTTVSQDTSGTNYTCSATSSGGTSSQSVTVKRDTSSPSVSCASADGVWHGQDVLIACSSGDSTSGLASSGDASFNLTTSVLAGTETSSASTDSRQVCDKAGNCSMVGPITGNKVDKKAPTINVVSPVNGTYLLNQSVTASYTCLDGGSGIANCQGPVANGGLVDTSTAGGHVFTVNAVDNVGNSSSPVGVHYSVLYGISVMFDQTKANKSGSTVPIKIRLVDANGVNVSSSSIVVHAVSVVQTSSQATTTLDDAGSANPDFDFRYDTTLGGYIFNLKTTGYGTGTYLLNYVIGANPNIYSVGFQVRQ